MNKYFLSTMVSIAAFLLSMPVSQAASIAKSFGCF